MNKRRLASLSDKVILALCTPFFLGVLLLSSFTAAGQYMYVPEDGIMLALDEKEDLKFSVAANAFQFKREIDWSVNYNLQAGYSPKDHFAIVGNFFKFWQSPIESDEQPESFSTHFTSIAAGSYLYKKKENRNNETTDAPSNSFRGTLLDFYMGYGLGNSRRQYEAGGHSKFYFHKFFMQAGMHLHEKRMGFSAIFRYSILDFDKGAVFGKFDGSDRDVLEYLEDNNPHHLLELSFRFSVKVAKNIRFYYSNATVLSALFLAKGSSSHFGLLIDIDKISKKTGKGKKRK